ncbi:tol-pal system YbgF family protein [Streptomyces sp. NPDC059892]|uniref:tetratricopeptide repeat protein n=1 Tax=unclassified Streptomyces TaxID=2593676 RepID=UPI00362D7E2D
MARHQPNRHLARLLNEARWNPAELARTINELGAAQGLRLRYDRTSVAHWLTGSRPRPPIPDLVASAFSRRCGRLVTTRETGLARGPQATEDPLLADQDVLGSALDQLAALTHADIDPARRAALAGSAYDLGTPAATLWSPGRPAVPSPAHTAGPRATPADVQRLRWMVHIFADLMERHGGAHARTALTAYLTDDTSRLLAAPARPSLRRELLSGAGQLTHLLARMSMDAGHPSLAQRYFTAALELAREADDRGLFATTLRAMSAQALHLGFEEHAGDLADAAVNTAGRRADPALRAFVLSQRALTHARARRRREAVRDLTAAETQHDRATGLPGPFTHYPRPGLDYQHGRTLIALGDTAGATRLFTGAAEARAEDRHRSSALTRARLADTLLTLGHLEESCAQWHVFLDHYPSLRSAPADQALRRLRGSLNGFRSRPYAAAVLHRARGLTAPPSHL